MPIEARRLLLLLGVGYLLVALGLGVVQFGCREILAGNPRNPRLYVPNPSTARGGILARGGEVITAGPGPLQRRYAIPSLCHTVGYASVRFGASGLEAVYDRVLSGRDPCVALANWLAELRGEPGRGGDLITTIDLRLQKAAALAIGSRPGAVVVLDAKNGDVLALVSRPGFHNPPTRATWEKERTRSDGPFLNRVLCGLYPPGSSFKIITAAAALEESFGGLELTCMGRVRAGGRWFKDAHAVGHGRLDLGRALVVSCNVYFTRLGLELGAERLIRRARAFGLGTAPPFALEAAEGTISWPRDPAEIAAMAMGQGRLLVTPLQMALVAAAVVNGGLIMQPRLVRAIRLPGGVEEVSTPRAWRRAMRPAAADLLRRHLEAAVKDGTGRRAAVPGLAVGGKTGTAQAPGGPPHAWFVGFARFSGRRLAIAVVVEHGGNGGEVAAPIAAAVWRAARGDGG